jgi:hypothetical protein
VPCKHRASPRQLTAAIAIGIVDRLKQQKSLCSRDGVQYACVAALERIALHLTEQCFNKLRDVDTRKKEHHGRAVKA